MFIICFIAQISMDFSDEELRNTSKTIKQKAEDGNKKQQDYKKMLQKDGRLIFFRNDCEDYDQAYICQSMAARDQQLKSIFQQFTFDVRQSMIEINNSAQVLTSKLISQYHVQEELIQSIEEGLNLRQSSIEYNIQPAVQIQEQNDYDQIKRPVKKKRMRRAQKNKYPTKNFLQCFRTPFLQYIQKHYKNDEKFNQFQIIKRIKAKKYGKQTKKGGINLRDFQDLFNEQEFRPILQNYFKQKVVMRDLMRSRTRYRLKRIFFKKIDVFEKAFKNKVFEKIN